MTKITYLFLTQEDKAKLQKLAKSKLLSLSTCADIIINNYFYIITNNQKMLGYEEKYIKKGNTKTCIKIRNKYNLPINTINATNCIIAYLQNNKYTCPNKTSIENARKKIQSQMDKTIDNNWDKNTIIRITWNYRKETK